MSGTARLLRVIGAALAVVLVGSLAWALFSTRNTEPSTAPEPQEFATLAPDPTSLPPETPSAIPTVTPPPPTPTPIPTPLPFVEAAPLGVLADLLSTPLPDCGLVRDDAVVAGTVTLTCIEEWATVPVVAAAEGRVVNVVRSTAVDVGASNLDPNMWSWAEQSQLGSHVVVDHGPLGETTNAQTVYAGLEAIEEGIGIGTMVSVGQPLGAVAGPSASLQFSVWANDERQDGMRVLGEAPAADEQRAIAAALRPVIASPTDPNCPLVLSYGQLPGAPRAYRNGTHRGIDFGCGAADRSAFAIADGTVVYLVNDYDDPTVFDRELLLQRAGIAGFTPHWTLVMLYGNVVVIDHGIVEGAGRVVTISAHLEAVDPALAVGSIVSKGQRLGELGNRGTNASALGLRGAEDPSLHLHWELFIDDWYLGSGLDGATTAELVATALCGAAETAGCPAS